jgi:hypothetical protein
MRQSTLCLAAVLALAALVASDIPASACPTTGPMYTETTRTDVLVTTDCWFNPAPNAMKIYQQRRKTCVTSLYQNITQCNGTVTKQLVSTVNTVVLDCYTPLATSCVGNKDWQPTPLCSATSC